MHAQVYNKKAPKILEHTWGIQYNLLQFFYIKVMSM